MNRRFGLFCEGVSSLPTAAISLDVEQALGTAADFSKHASFGSRDAVRIAQGRVIPDQGSG